MPVYFQHGLAMLKEPGMDSQRNSSGQGFSSSREIGMPSDKDSGGKESSCSEGYLGLIPGLGRSPGEGNSYPLQYSGLENSMDRGSWWATVYGLAKTEQLSLSLHFQIRTMYGSGSKGIK